MRNVLKRIFEFMSVFLQLLVFELWSILYFTFIVHSGLGRIKIFFMLVGSTPLNPPFLGRLGPRTPTPGPGYFWI